MEYADISQPRPRCGNPGGIVKHGMADTKIHYVWKAIKNRCLNPKSKDFQNYGGRGIKICARWAGSFESFISDMGRPQPGQMIERIDNNGHYEPSNCRWASRKEQNNNSRHNAFITFRGKTQSLRQWCDELDKNYWTVHHRYRYQQGLTLEQIFA